MLRYCFGEEEQAPGTYYELADYCEQWMALKPSSFTPIYYKEGDEASPFPEIWLLGDAVVTAMQVSTLILKSRCDDS